MPDTENSLTEEIINKEQLIRAGRESGYLTLDEILAVFPEAENDLERLDQVLGILVEAGVEIGEPREEESEQEESEQNGDAKETQAV